MCVEQDCLLWGSQIVIPRNVTTQVLQELHDTHLSIMRMKSLTRLHVWWPKIDRDIEQFVYNVRLVGRRARPRQVYMTHRIGLPSQCNGFVLTLQVYSWKLHFIRDFTLHVVKHMIAHVIRST